VFDFYPDLPQSGSCRMSGEKSGCFRQLPDFRVKTDRFFESVKVELNADTQCAAKHIAWKLLHLNTIIFNNRCGWLISFCFEMRNYFLPPTVMVQFD
jgi:hypothetical protein